MKRKTKMTTSIFDPLPEDLTTNILSRLPVRDVFRCRSVSKPWLSLIDNPRFIKSHSSFILSPSSQITDPSSFIYLPQPHKGNLYMIEEEEASSSSSSVKCSKFNIPRVIKRVSPPPFLVGCSNGPFLVGCSNGLVCFSTCDYMCFDFSPPSIYISNPLIQHDCLTLPELPIPDSSYDACRILVAFGFGFDPSSKQFKVLHVYLWGNTKCWRALQSEAHVFTLGSNSWRNVDGCVKVGENIVYGVGGSEACVNDSLHWRSSHTFEIVTFDLISEKFGVMPFPCPAHRSHFRLGVLGGCLSLLDLTCQNTYVLWIKKDYRVEDSWTKQFVVEKSLFNKFDITVYGVIYPVCFWKDGEEVILLWSHRVLLSYNHKSGIVTPIQHAQLAKLKMNKFRRTSFRACPYVVSLISPKSP